MYFNDVVGQEPVKRLLSFYLEGYKNTKSVPHLMFTAPRGCGKTMIATAMAKHLHEISVKGTGEKKPLVTLNCSSIRAVGHFFNAFVIPNMINRDATILFDEASELPKDVTMALLTICNPNKTNVNVFTYDNVDIYFDFRRLTFMFATTEGQSIFHALMDRTKRVDLSDYSNKDLWDIIKLGIENKCQIDEGLAEEVTSTLRGNARKAQQMADDILKYSAVREIKKINAKNWEEMKELMDILPLGLLKQELYLLRALARKAETRLTELAAIMGLSRSSVQKDYETHLLKTNLIEIDTTGRRLTSKGRRYLEKINA